MKTLIGNIIIFFIKAYQNSFSKVFPSVCRFSPSCSNYMIDAIKRYNFFKGISMGVIRILKCHPLSKKSGWDPVK